MGKDQEKARAAFDLARKEDPGLAAATVELAFVHVVESEISEARRLLDSLRSAPPGTEEERAREQFVRGHLAYAVGNASVARGLFEEANRLHPGQALYVAWTGIATPAASRDPQILARALALGKGTPAVVLLDAFAHPERKSRGDSQQRRRVLTDLRRRLIQDMSAALKSFPESPYLAIHLPRLYSLEGDHKRAEELARGVLRRWGRRLHTFIEAGWVHVQAGADRRGKAREAALEEASTVFLRGRKAFRTSPVLLRELAWLEVLRRRYPRALRLHLRVIEIEGKVVGWTHRNAYHAYLRWFTSACESRNLAGLEDVHLHLGQASEVVKRFVRADPDQAQRLGVTSLRGSSREPVAGLRAFAARLYAIQRMWGLSDALFQALEREGLLDSRGLRLRFLSDSERLLYSLRRDPKLLKRVHGDLLKVLKSDHPWPRAVSDALWLARLHGFSVGSVPEPTTDKHRNMAGPEKFALAKALGKEPRDPKAVVEAWFGLVKVEPGNMIAWLQLLEGLVRSRNYRTGRRSLLRVPSALQREPLMQVAGSRVFGGLGQAEGSVDFLDRAVQLLDQALEASPECQQARLGRIRYRLLLGDGEGAKRDLQSLPPTSIGLRKHAELLGSAEELIRGARR